MRGREEELERMLQQKVALAQIFEGDLLQMTEKLIAQARPAKGAPIAGG